MEENFPGLMKEVLIRVQEKYKTPNRQDQKINYPQHIIINILNLHKKERVLKDVEENLQVTYKDRTIRIIADFSMETLKPRKTSTNSERSWMPFQSIIPPPKNLSITKK